MSMSIVSAGRRAVFVQGLVAGLCLLLAGATVYLSMTGRPRPLFPYERQPLESLPADTDIAGWAAIDRDSISLGEAATLRFRVLYRDGIVEPDLDAFRRSMNTGRFSSLGLEAAQRTVAPGIKEYTVDQVFQAVAVAPHRSYHLDPVVLFYKSSKAVRDELEKLRIVAPAVYVSGAFPENVSGFPLRPLRERTHDPLRLRQAVVMGCGAVLLLLAGLLVWRLGYRRRSADLSAAERLWTEFNSWRPASPDPQGYLLFCESVFTRLRQACTGATADAFWTGDDPEEPMWRRAAEDARTVLRRVYHPGGASAEDVDAMAALLRTIFANVVAEQKLRREQEPSFLRRAWSQPAGFALANLGAGLAFCLLALGMMPHLWLSSAVTRYSDATERTRSDLTRMQAASDLSALSQQVSVPDLRVSALYNAGTALAQLDPLNRQLVEDETAIIGLFKDAPSLEPVVKSQTLLSQAEEHLRAAILSGPADEDVRRNLELVTKRHRTVASALVELLKMQEERVVLNADQLSLLDALNMTLQEDAKDNDKAVKRDYYIGEKF